MDRIWKVSPYSNKSTNFITQIKIDKKLMLIEQDIDISLKEDFWLAIDNLNSSKFNYRDAKYIKASVNDQKEIVFDSVEFLSNSEYYFTLIKSSENPNSIIIDSISSTKIVLKEDNLNNFKFYPNPVYANEKFTIDFNLTTLSNVLIEITDLDGKVLKNNNLGLISKYSVTESLRVSGTYLILIYINDTLQTTKLIVK